MNAVTQARRYCQKVFELRLNFTREKVQDYGLSQHVRRWKRKARAIHVNKKRNRELSGKAERTACLECEQRGLGVPGHGGRVARVVVLWFAVREHQERRRLQGAERSARMRSLLRGSAWSVRDEDVEEALQLNQCSYAVHHTATNRTVLGPELRREGLGRSLGHRGEGINDRMNNGAHIDEFPRPVDRVKGKPRELFATRGRDGRHILGKEIRNDRENQNTDKKDEETIVHCLR